MSLTDRDRRAISDLMRTGVVRTTERLEKITRAKWGVMSSSVREVLPVQLLSSFKRREERCVGAHFSSSSLLPLEFLIIFPEGGAQALAKAVTSPYAERMKGVLDIVSMTVGEVSNYLAQSVLSVIADEYNVMIILKTPEVVIGKKVEILEMALQRYDGREDTLLVSQVDIYSKDIECYCNMVIIVNSEMIRKLAATRKA